MPELVIKYKSNKTLEALLNIAKYFDFSIEKTEKVKKNKINNSNGVMIIPADSSVNISELETIFSNKNIDFQNIRNKAWLRNQ